MPCDLQTQIQHLHAELCTECVRMYFYSGLKIQVRLCLFANCEEGICRFLMEKKQRKSCAKILKTNATQSTN